METKRQQKINSLLQKDLVDILQKAAKQGFKGVLISVSKVTITVDLSIAKVYLSIFPKSVQKELIEGIKSNKSSIKHELAQRTRHQIRKVPDLVFYIDDSLDYIEGIDNALKGKSGNPIYDNTLLEKRKK